MKKNLKIRLPFEGFHESMPICLLDEALQDVTQAERLPYDHQSYDEHIATVLFSKRFVGALQDFMNFKFSMNIKLEFDSLVSPAFYCVDTDAVYARIDYMDALSILNKTDHGILRGTVDMYYNLSEDLSVRDASEVRANPWGNDIQDWSCEQLEILVRALFYSYDMDCADLGEVYESIDVHQIIKDSMRINRTGVK